VIRAGVVRILGAMLIVVGITLGALPLRAQPATPADAPPVETEATVDFPRGMRFVAMIPTGNPEAIDRVELLYRIGRQETLNLAVVPSGGLSSKPGGIAVDLFVDMQASTFVPLGVELSFRWAGYAGDTRVLTTPEESASWVDPRFIWKTRQSGQVTLYSYGLSDTFANDVLESAQSTISELERRYGLARMEPISVWIYDSSEDFSATRQTNSREAIAGISYPEAGVIAAVIRDGDERELGRVLPHEVSHHVLYQATRNPFAVTPLWFDEGLATRFQIGGTDHYAGMVQRAADEGRLFDIASLNAAFPFQPSQATLAYASSWSMIAYIEETYGDAGIARLIAAFADGADTGSAVQAALGISLTALNAGWHAWAANVSTEDIAA